MSLKKFRPITPSLRSMILLDRSELSKDRPVKSLTVKIQSTSGRNNQGRITSRRRGAGHKKLYRIVDFKRNKPEVEGVIHSVEYDPNRNCRIALVHYVDGEKRYIIMPVGLNKGDRVVSSKSADIKPGNCKQLKDIPTGTVIHNVELHPGGGGQLARSAGTFAQLMAKEGDLALIRLPSGELRKVKKECHATIGQVGNVDHEKISIGKAGKSRAMGIRPSVRGVAMNPVDHPLGGGEGKTSGGRHPVTPWGMPTKGYKTRKNKATNKYIVKRRK